MSALCKKAPFPTQIFTGYQNLHFSVTVGMYSSVSHGRHKTITNIHPDINLQLITILMCDPHCD